jgi:RepB DNA-primase from phage plasmid
MVIEELWADQPGDYFCLATKDAGGRWRDHFFSRDEIDVSEFIREHRRKNVYFCPHGFTRRSRRKQYAVAPKCLWADLDDVPPRCSPRPTIAIASSVGRYVGLWLTDRPVTEELNKRLTYALGADRGGWDLTQVLRVPGTLNWKYDPPPRVRVLWEEGPRYRVAGLCAQLPPLPCVQERHDEGEWRGGDWREVVRRLRAPAVISMVQDRHLNGVDRSRLIACIAGRLYARGASVAEVACVIGASQAFKQKFGDRGRTPWDEAVSLKRWSQL